MGGHDVFGRAVAWLFDIEGGYVDDPADRGGETKFGISARSYPDLDIAALTEAQAREIYYRDYWLKAGCDDLPPVLARALFDAAVNHGRRTGTVLLQQALGVTADGIVGPVTRSAAERADQFAALAEYLSRRALLYHDLTIADRSQARFLRGWLRRVVLLQKSIHESWLA